MSRLFDLLEGMGFESDLPPRISREVYDPLPPEMRADSRIKDAARVRVTDSESSCCHTCGCITTSEQLFCTECGGFLGQTYTDVERKIARRAEGLDDKQRRRSTSKFMTLRRWLRL
jgi:hypothetical protein